MSKPRKYLPVPLVLLFSLSVLSAQTPAAPTDFTIVASDLLEISVLGVPDFPKEQRVSASGTIRLPFIGEILVQGLAPSQLEPKLKDLLDPDYVKDPQVSVIIKEPRSRMFTILGAVLRPGQSQMLDSVTLVTAIAGAGGLDLTKAGDTAVIQRSYGIGTGWGSFATSPVSAGEEKHSGYRIEVDLKKLMMGGDQSLDIPIMPGDAINIPQRVASSVFVIGDVTTPGPFDFPAEGGIKLSRALALAGGPIRTSKMKSAALIRQRPDGSMDRVALNLGNVLKGKAPALDMQPGRRPTGGGTRSCAIGS